MKKVALATVLFFFATVPALSQTLDDLKNDGKNTDNVFTYGMGYHQLANVPRGGSVWAFALMD